MGAEPTPHSVDCGLCLWRYQTGASSASNKHIETLPRMLTIWLNWGALVHSSQDQPRSSEDSDTIWSTMLKLNQHIVRQMDMLLAPLTCCDAVNMDRRRFEPAWQATNG